MLAVLRKRINGPATKLIVIFLLLSFVLWGVSDIFRKGNKSVAFKAGNIEYSESEWYSAFQRAIQNLSNQFNTQITQEQIKAQGLHHMIMENIVSSLLIEQELADIRLLVSDDMAKSQLAGFPELQKDGKFDTEKFEQILQITNQTEAEFIKRFKQDMAKNILIGTIGLNQQVPELLATQLATARAISHKADVIKINAKNFKVAKQPTDEQLRETYNQNINRFSTEEKKDISYIVFDPDSIKASNEVTESILKEQYEARKSLFTEPEKRFVSQMLFNNEDMAQDALKKLDSGIEFKDLAKKLFPGQKDFSIGEITEQGLAKEVSAPIFSTEAGKYSQIAQSPLGYHIFFIDNVIPSNTKSFEEVKALLKKQYLEDLKFEALSKMAQDMDSMVASSENLNTIAAKYDLKVYEIKNFSQGAQKQNDAITQSQVFKNLVAATDSNSTSMVTPITGQDKFVIINVGKVEKAQPIPFEEVKENVKDLWLSLEKQKQLQESANDIFGKLSNGEKADAVIKNSGYGSVKTISVNFMDAQQNEYPAELKEKILQADLDGITIPINDNDGNYYIAKIVAIQRGANISDEAKGLAMNELMQQFPNEILNQYLSYLRKKFGVEVNDKVIESVIR